MEVEEARRPQRDRYGILLILLLVAILLVPVESPVLRPVVAALLAGVLLFAQRTSGARRQLMTISAILAAAGVVACAAAQIAADREARMVYSAIVVLLCAATITTIGAHLVRDPGLDVHIVLGVIVVYILLGFAFSGTYAFLGAWHGDFFAQTTAAHDGVDYFYFSFITITTTGFGDLTPKSDTGQMIAAVEALIGQVYLVTVVALAVSGVTRRRARS